MDALDVFGSAGYIHAVYKEWCMKNADYLVELEGIKGVAHSKDLMDRMTAEAGDTFDEFLDSSQTDDEECKSEEKAVEYKEAGNKLYQAKKFREAIEQYTKSAMNAHSSSAGSTSLAVAFANRSAVLFQMKEFSRCLEDIGHALESGYPEASRYKLLERRIKCLLQLDQVTDLNNHVNDFVTALKSASLGADKEKAVGQDLMKLIEKTAAGRKSQQQSKKPTKDTTVVKIPNANAKIPCFSVSADVAYNAEFGRYVVATRNICAGELLMVEEPQVSVIGEDVVGRLCSNCFRSSLNFLPSPFSNKEVFCSRRCLDAARNGYLRTESPIGGQLSKCGLQKKEWFLALRAVTQKNLEYFKENRKAIFDNHDPLHGTRKDDTYTSADGYREAFNLVTNADAWNTPTNLFKCFVVCFLVKCLERAGYFKGSVAEEKDKAFIGRLLLHFMEVSTMNCHQIGHLRATTGADDDVYWHAASPASVGCALNPSVSLMNHSCDPVVTKINVGKKTLVYASRDLKEGQEITDCYFPQGQSSPREGRQNSLLQQYGFTCKCRACIENWPVLSQLPRGLNDVPPEKFRFALDDIKKMQVQFSCIQKLGSKINNEQKNGAYNEVLALSIEFLKVLDDTMERPHQFFTMTVKSLNMALWALYGSKDRWITRGGSEDQEL